MSVLKCIVVFLILFFNSKKDYCQPFYKSTHYNVVDITRFDTLKIKALIWSSVDAISTDSMAIIKQEILYVVKFHSEMPTYERKMDDIEDYCFLDLNKKIFAKHPFYYIIID